MTGGRTRRFDRKTPHRFPPKTPESASPPGEGKIAGMTEGSACEGWVPGGWFDTVPSASSGQALRRLRPGHFDKLRPGSPRTGVRPGIGVARKMGGSESPPLREIGRGRRDDGEKRKARSLGGPGDDRWVDEALRPEDPSPISAEDAGILRLAQDRFCLSPRRGEDRGDDGRSACEGWVPGGGSTRSPSASSGQALRQAQGRLFDKLRTGSPRTGVRPDRSGCWVPAGDAGMTEGSACEGWVPGGWFDTVLRRLRPGSPRTGGAVDGWCWVPAGDAGARSRWTRRFDRKTPHRLPPKTPESFDWLRTGSASPPGEGKIAGMTEGSACEDWVPGGWFDTVPSTSSGQATSTSSGQAHHERGCVGMTGRRGRRDLSADLGMTGGWGRRFDRKTPRRFPPRPLRPQRRIPASLPRTTPQ